ncbi:MAG: M16 family metallopeptidase [bacterium]
MTFTKKLSQLLITGLIVCLFPSLVSALSRPERMVLDNGLVLIVLEQHALPFVVMELSVKAGSVFDPPGKSGLASLTADLLNEGTGKRSALQISEEIDYVGGSLSSGGGLDYAEMNLKVLKKDLSTGFELLSDCLTNPAFSQKELERVRKETIASIIEQKDDPHSVAGKAFKKLVYPGHPYRFSPEGEEDTLPEITRNDVTGFYKKYYHPDNALLVVVGDTDSREIKGLIKKYWSGWKKEKTDFPQIPEIKRQTSKKIKLVNKQLTQATVILGHLGIKRTSPDYYSVYVMNYILGGGGFSARLLTEIRDKQGLAYSAASYFAPSVYTGSFQAFVQTKNATTNQVIEATLKEMKKIQESPVTEQELKDAKSYITGSFPLKLDTNAKIAGYLSYIEHYNLGLDYFQKFPDYINRVTIEDIQKAARKYLDPEYFQLVVVADQKKAAVSLN